MARPCAFLLLLIAAHAVAADPPGLAEARQAATAIDATIEAMASTSFTAQRRAAEDAEDVRAWRDGRDVRKVEVAQREAGRERRTRYYYGLEGRLVAWAVGVEASAAPAGDPATAEGAERLAAAAFYRDAARLSFDKQARNEQRSLCSDRETAVFACRVGTKLASVCVSKDAARDRGTLQFRVGVAGSRLPLEVAAPADAMPPSRAASGESVAFSGGGGSWLRLREGDAAYVTYSGVGRWGPRGETREKQGVLVERGGKIVSHLRCTERYETLPDGEWFEAMGVDRGSESFDFPD